MPQADLTEALDDVLFDLCDTYGEKAFPNPPRPI